MGRYSNIPERKTDKNNRVSKSVLLPTIKPTSTDIYIITTAGDRLDSLAYKYYGTVGYWWIIAQANPENNIGKGTMVLPQGVQLRIPTNPVDIITELNDLNKD